MTTETCFCQQCGKPVTDQSMGFMAGTTGLHWGTCVYAEQLRARAGITPMKINAEDRYERVPSDG